MGADWMVLSGIAAEGVGLGGEGHCLFETQCRRNSTAVCLLHAVHRYLSYHWSYIVHLQLA